MPAPDPHCDLSKLDLGRVIADIRRIRECLPQRPPFEMLTAIVAVNPEERLIVGYKDVTSAEFWVPGHMPDYPLLPGVLMCEAAAQLSANPGFSSADVARLLGFTSASHLAATARRIVGTGARSLDKLGPRGVLAAFARKGY